MRAIEQAAARIRESGSNAIDEVAQEVREFRRWLHEFVTVRMGKPLRAIDVAVAPLNESLAPYCVFPRVESAGRDDEDGWRLLLRRVRRRESSEAL